MQTHRPWMSRIYRIYKIVGVALLGVLVVSATSIRVIRSIREKHGLYTDALTVIFESPLSPNKVHENALDSNGDRKPDQWTVYIRDGEPWMCEYFLDDLDFDGTPDVWSLAIGDRRIHYHLSEDDNDAKPDKLSVSMADFSDKSSAHFYLDLNLDGLFDTMSRMHGGKALERFVLLDGAWTPVVKGDLRAREVLIRGEDGGEDKVVFDGGKWQVMQGGSKPAM